jgi:hypothetical protein
MIFNEEDRFLAQGLQDKDWMGIVEDNEDPEFEFRCRIRVLGLFDELPIEAIPWAFPANQGIFASAGGGFGSGSVPKVGTMVKVKFNSGSKYAPEYYAIQNINSGLKGEISGDYQGTHVLVYDEDEDLKIIYQKGVGIKIHLKDSHVTINPDTSITIEHSSSESIIELLGPTINIVSSNEVNITAENCNVDSPNIKLGANAVESVIKGDSFKAVYDSHTHPAAGAPPAVPLPTGVLSKNTKTR